MPKVKFSLHVSIKDGLETILSIKGLICFKRGPVLQRLWTNPHQGDRPLSHPVWTAGCHLVATQQGHLQRGSVQTEGLWRNRLGLRLFRKQPHHSTHFPLLFCVPRIRKLVVVIQWQCHTTKGHLFPWENMHILWNEIIAYLNFAAVTQSKATGIRIIILKGYKIKGSSLPLPWDSLCPFTWSAQRYFSSPSSVLYKVSYNSNTLFWGFVLFSLNTL